MGKHTTNHLLGVKKKTGYAHVEGLKENEGINHIGPGTKSTRRKHLT